MKLIKSTDLLTALQADVRRLLTNASQLQQYATLTLQQPPSPAQWSVAQVLEHLNIYCRYYIPAIESRLHLHRSNPTSNFKPGWLGNYFTGLMLPGNNNIISRKMKAPKNAIPSAQPDAQQQLEEFIGHQHQLLVLLQLAATADLGKIRIPISISKWIKLKLGDTFRFFIAHQQRHFVQIENVLDHVARQAP